MSLQIVRRQPPPVRRGPVAMRARAVAPDELDLLVPAWRALAAASAPNVFLEPWMLQPALRYLRDGADVEVVIVEGGGEMHALAAFHRRKRWRGLPVAARSSWSFRHCYLGTPLCRVGHEREALSALLDWAAGAAPLLELRDVAAGGAVHRTLVDLANERGLEAVALSRHSRALLAPATTTVEEAVSSGKRKELRRQERRLAELGPLSTTWLGSHEDPRRAVDELLALEIAGWKGKENSAMACDGEDRRFFEAACRAAHADGRLLLSTLRVGGRPVAAKCSFLAAPGAFAFKIAYDESLAAFSPGVLLELDNMRRLRGRPDVAWMDSCASWDHPMINHLWPGRQAIETLLIAPGGGPLASALVAAAPLLRRLRHSLGRPS